ncbi:MAG TPA: dethiobiotin synthase [Methylophilaceae bacterium]|nr:dethiobiotin synthase [Methylophilaceae bacterium]
MKHGFFVTGTDTGVGKTLVSAALVYKLVQASLRAAGMKPVAAGCVIRNGRLVSDDVEQLCAAGNATLAPDVANPYAFEPALAPHIAARQAGVVIELMAVREAFMAAAQEVEALVVEGVGGFRVPLNDIEDTADMAVLLGLPVILVVGMRLGCLNHALLTAEAIASRGLVLAGWVANRVDPAMSAFEDNLAALCQRLSAPCLGVLPHLEAADFQAAAGHLDISAIR